MTALPVLTPITVTPAPGIAACRRIAADALRERGPDATDLRVPVMHSSDEDHNADCVRAAAQAYLEAVMGTHGDVDGTGAVDWSEAVTEGYAECLAVVRVRVGV